MLDHPAPGFLGGTDERTVVAEVGGREVAKLADFGLARTYQTSPLSGLSITGQFGCLRKISRQYAISLSMCARWP